MSWLRWWAGTVNDPKWRIIAARANCRPGDCLAVWAYLLEIAKDGDGDISKHDPEECAVVLGYDHLLVETIIVAMRDKELIVDGRLASWEKRQPKREDGSAERAKAWREHKKLETNATERTRTQPNAPESDTETDTDKKKDKAKALSKKGTRLDPDWAPVGDDAAMAISLLGGRYRAGEEVDKFKDYWRSVPGAKGVKLDWDATWRNWVRSAAERKGHSPPKRQTTVEAANELLEEMRDARAKNQSPFGDVQFLSPAAGGREIEAEYLPAPVVRIERRGGD